MHPALHHAGGRLPRGAAGKGRVAGHGRLPAVPLLGLVCFRSDPLRLLLRLTSGGVRASVSSLMQP